MSAQNSARQVDWLRAFLNKDLSDADADAEAQLIDVLTRDPDGIVRHEAAFVLGELYDRGRISGDRALLALCKVAREDPSIVARHEAAESLGVFEHPLATETLMTLVTDPVPDVAATAAIALARRAAVGT